MLWFKKKNGNGKKKPAEIPVPRPVVVPRGLERALDESMIGGPAAFRRATVAYGEEQALGTPRVLDGEPALLFADDPRLGGWHINIVKIGDQRVQQELPQVEHAIDGRTFTWRALHLMPGVWYTIGFNPEPVTKDEIPNPTEPPQICVRMIESLGNGEYDDHSPANVWASARREEHGKGLERVVLQHWHYKHESAAVATASTTGRKFPKAITGVYDRHQPVRVNIGGQEAPLILQAAKSVVGLQPGYRLRVGYHAQDAGSKAIVPTFLPGLHKTVLYVEGLLDAEGKPVSQEVLEEQQEKVLARRAEEQARAKEAERSRMREEFGDREIFWAYHPRIDSRLIISALPGLEAAVRKEQVKYTPAGKTEEGVYPGLRWDPERIIDRFMEFGAYGVLVGSEEEFMKELLETDYRGWDAVVINDMERIDLAHAAFSFLPNGGMVIGRPALRDEKGKEGSTLSDKRILYQLPGQHTEMLEQHPVLLDTTLPYGTVAVFGGEGNDIRYKMSLVNRIRK